MLCTCCMQCLSENAKEICRANQHERKCLIYGIALLWETRGSCKIEGIKVNLQP